jgi:hypothetical protein
METLERGFDRLRTVAEQAAAPSDRDLQDEVIRYLTDARLRSHPDGGGLITQSEAQRAQRFSRFLARRYYRDRLSRGFRYARLLSSFAPEQLTESPAFDSILESCILGSLATALTVAELALSQLRSLRSDAWWSELLEYERAFFLQLATSESVVRNAFPQKQSATVLRTFSMPVPELLRRIKNHEDLASLPAGAATLLFSRTPHGRVYVAEVDVITAKAFQAVDGQKQQREIALACQSDDEEIHRTLDALSQIGSIVLPQEP